MCNRPSLCFANSRVPAQSAHPGAVSTRGLAHRACNAAQTRSCARTWAPPRRMSTAQHRRAPEPREPMQSAPWSDTPSAPARGAAQRLPAAHTDTVCRPLGADRQRDRCRTARHPHRAASCASGTTSALHHIARGRPVDSRTDYSLWHRCWVVADARPPTMSSPAVPSSVRECSRRQQQQARRSCLQAEAIHAVPRGEIQPA
jgi:hypothetical protein